jgi:hypothetical protein
VTWIEHAILVLCTASMRNHENNMVVDLFTINNEMQLSTLSLVKNTSRFVSSFQQFQVMSLDQISYFMRYVDYMLQPLYGSVTLNACLTV